MGKCKELKSKAQLKIKRAKMRMKSAKIEAKRFMDEHPEVVIAGITATAGAIKAGQSFVVNRRVAKERKRIDRTWYDPRTGMHWDLRRKLTNPERAEILNRRAMGQSAYDILAQMNVLK